MSDENTEQQTDWEAAAKAAGWIPPQRLSEVVTERNALRDEVASLKASGLEGKAEHEAALAAAQKAAAEAAERLSVMEGEKAWTLNEVMLAREGVHDADVVDFLKYRYEQAEAGEDGSKPAFGDWFGEYKATEPAILRTAAGQPDPRPKPPANNNGVKTAPPTDALANPWDLTREQYQAQREALLQQHGTLKA